MVVVVVLVCVVLLGGLAGWAFRRRGSDEMHSVAGYQHRLARLEEARRRQVATEVPSTSDSLWNEQRPRDLRPLRRRAAPGEQAAIVQGTPHPRHRGTTRDVSLARMSHRPRRLFAPIAASVAVIVVVTGLALLGAHLRSPHPKAASTTQLSTPKGRHHLGAHKTTVTTPTVPTSFSPVSTDGSQATYSLPFASYTLTVDASSNGDCWVEITNSSGQVPYAQVLPSGSSEQLMLGGNSKLELGAPGYVTIEVDGTPLKFPSPMPDPLDVDLEAAASGSGAAGA
ncbi:MAG: DUF4115 domain-containing protein [Acidimicrobiales bacterium]